uniref:WAP domain-containing protein n=1 Tax=Crocodylus porosus TaxID=8502 RepID=A0A7M4ELI5_CROPO
MFCCGDFSGFWALLVALASSFPFFSAPCVGLLSLPRGTGLLDWPGVCPSSAPGVLDPCFFPCSSDYSCPGSQKCCLIPCGQACLDPLPGKASTGAISCTGGAGHWRAL